MIQVFSFILVRGEAFEKLNNCHYFRFCTRFSPCRAVCSLCSSLSSSELGSDCWRDWLSNSVSWLTVAAETAGERLAEHKICINFSFAFFLLINDLKTRFENYKKSNSSISPLELFFLPTCWNFFCETRKPAYPHTIRVRVFLKRARESGRELKSKDKHSENTWRGI